MAEGGGEQSLAEIMGGWGNTPGRPGLPGMDISLNPLTSNSPNPHVGNFIGQQGWGPFSQYATEKDQSKYRTGLLDGLYDKGLEQVYNVDGLHDRTNPTFTDQDPNDIDKYKSSWEGHVENSYNSAANVPGYYATKMQDLASRLGINPPAQKPGLAHNMRVASLAIPAKARNLLQGFVPEQFRQNLEIGNWANEMMGGDLGEMGVAGGTAGSHHF
jgi:hypothetical protein|tara:strand:+ start:506 stop:1150 length:645 start_codon:yes stop_codon:yes gene_type:complete